MAEWFTSGRIPDVIIALMALEGVALLIWRRRSGGAVSGIAANLVSGGCLVLALRAALTSASWMWMAVFLSGAFAAHLVDVAGRLRD